MDSRDRNYLAWPHPEEYVVSLPSPLRNVVGVRVTSVEFPDVANLLRNKSVTVAGVTHTIPDGIYDPLVLTGLLNDLFAGLTSFVYEAGADAIRCQSPVDPVSTLLPYLEDVSRLDAHFKIFLDIRDVGTVVENSASHEGCTAIPLAMKGSNFGYTFLDGGWSPVHPMRPSTFHKLHLKFRAYDETSDAVNFQGLEHSLTLEVTFLDKKKPLP